MGCWSWIQIDSRDRKLVIIGDGACGKTSLLSVFTLGYFPTVGSSTTALRVDNIVAHGLNRDMSPPSSRTTLRTVASTANQSNWLYGIRQAKKTTNDYGR